MAIIKEDISIIEDPGKKEDCIITTVEEKELTTSLQELVNELQRLVNEYPNAVVSELIGLSISTDPGNNKELTVDFRTDF